MDPRAVELSDIVKFHPTEESLKETSIRRDDALHVSKEPFRIYQRKNNGILQKLPPTGFSNVISVAKEGGDFTSIKEANDFISPTSVNRYTIQVAPGTYIENNPIQLKQFVTIEAMGIHSVVIQPLNASTDLFLGEKFTHLIGVIFDVVTGVSNYAVNHSVAGELLIEDCVFRNCSNGILLNNNSAGMEIYNCVANTPTVSTGKLVHVTSGNIIIDGLIARATATIDTLVEIDGITSIATITGVLSFSPNLTNGFVFLNGARIAGNGNGLVGCYDGMIVSGNNTNVRLDTFKIFLAQNDGFRIDNIGTGIEVSMFSTTISNCVSLNFNILNPNCVVSGSGFTEFAKSFTVSGAEFYAYILDITEGDEGLNILGECHVGSPTRPTESVFGGGDSYTNGMIVFTESAGGSFVDVSVNARSISASTFTFPGIAIDNAIYIASILDNGTDVLEHFGIKALVNTAAVKGIGSIIVEYWNGTAWVEIEAMEVESSGQYFPHACDYFSNTGSHHIRYNSQLAVDAWTKNDPIIPAIGTEYYWIRFRIDSAITTAPIFEQFKIHTNRSEINADGWLEYFGKARPIGQLGLNFSSARPFEGNMQSQTIYINEDIGVGFTQNKFTATGDKTGIAGFLPFDFDTSSPIKLQWSGMPTNNQTIEWTIRIDWVTDNGSDLYFTTEPAASPGRKIVTVSKAITANEVSMFEAIIDVKEMLSRRDGAFGDEIWISIQPSILTGTFAITSSQATYTKWCEGGHI